MTLTDPLANALSKILNCEKARKKECIVRSSKIIKEVLKIMNENLYIGKFEEIESTRGNELRVALLSNINKCGAIKPRHAVNIETYPKFEKRYLPAKDFGILIVSTNKGIMTHTEAKEKNLGGRLLAYCY
ncbi:MAG: 30S ribosomal protein S8 [Candidatus Woesearchaeota archaeon]